MRLSTKVIIGTVILGMFADTFGAGYDYAKGWVINFTVEAFFDIMYILAAAAFVYLRVRRYRQRRVQRIV